LKDLILITLHIIGKTPKEMFTSLCMNMDF